MSEFFVTMVREEINKRGLSYRQAADEIGTTHTTISRILDGKPYDLDTAQKVARWLGVPITEILEIEAPGEDGLAAQIAAALRAEPKLAEVFGEAMERVASGGMSVEAFRELATYVAIRLNLSSQEE